MASKYIASTILSFMLLSTGLEAGRIPSSTAVTIPSDTEVAAMEKKLLKMINAERAKEGLEDLKVWDVVVKYAKEHSVNMALNKVKFGHEGFRDRAHAIIDQGKNVRCVGENVAYNYGKKDQLKAAVEGWMNSPGHRKNILGDYDETGIGIAFSKDGYCYLTQIFSKKTRKK